MFVVAPLSTDAAIDHNPWGTVAIVVANVAVALFMGYPEFSSPDLFWMEEPPDPPAVNSWVLIWDEFNPFQWITHAFVHADFWHLAFNMVFLWVFGIVVEGAIGLGRFLLIYAFVAITPGALGQILVQNTDTVGAVGASAAISGLMAVAALWAPKTRIRIFVWIITFMRKPEVSVFGFCALWIGLDLLFALLGGFALSSEMAHLTGAVLGLGVGIVALKKEWVDCEGWDYLSIRKHGDPRFRLSELKHEVEIDLPTDFQFALDRKAGHRADEIAERMEAVQQDWAPTRRQLALLISLLRREDPERCADRMRQSIARYPDGSASMRIMLADTLVDLGRPTAALEELDQLDDAGLNERQRMAKAQVRRRAMRRPSGGLELE